MRQNFTAYGAAQFLRDLNAIFSLVDRYIPNGLGPLANLHDALRLLTLPVTPPQAPEGGAATTGLSLKQATDRAFTDNEEARLVIEELGIETLTPANVRHILQRRVENKE